ncbi:MAG: hypothetical protein KJZ69_07750 [Phycisphaerales bacterium]|nr:hypothetical protein [Phycisphaerales bacterium]
MRRRLRSTCKWSGAVLTVLLFVVWVGSARWMVWSEPRDDLGLGIRSGCFLLAVDESGRMMSGTRFELARNDHSFTWWFWTLWISLNPVVGVVSIPVWFLALLLAVPTIWLWYRDRRRAPGLCTKCGYDLRGMDHAVCPECGGDVAASRAERT